MMQSPRSMLLHDENSLATNTAHVFRLLRRLERPKPAAVLARRVVSSALLRQIRRKTSFTPASLRRLISAICWAPPVRLLDPPTIESAEPFSATAAAYLPAPNIDVLRLEGPGTTA
jgi:hypothetical protein